MGEKLVYTVGYRLERILKLLENDLKQFYLTEQTLNVFNTVFMFDRKFVGWLINIRGSFLIRKNSLVIYGWIGTKWKFM